MSYGREGVTLANDPVIGHCLFADGVTRPIYCDDQGQYIIDEGARVYGRFLDDNLEDSTV